MKKQLRFPWKQRFVSGLAFSIYEVICIVCQLRSCKQTNYASDKWRKWLWMLKAMPESNSAHRVAKIIIDSVLWSRGFFFEMRQG